MDRAKIRDIFADALDLPPAERHLFVTNAFPDDPASRDEVLSLLAAAGARLLSAGTVDATPQTPEPLSLVGAQFGPYRLLEEIGEGGFAIVYMAEQLSPIRRRVAIKVLKPGMDTRQVVARFEAERHTLAMMEHPNIARVLDAGTVPVGSSSGAGLPYFVMELVRGQPITEFADAQRLDTHARLELFTAVCAAVHHAHQKGIIHRDLKPTNVLVTLHDGKPVPKVIDFGIAKALAGNQPGQTFFTGFRQMIGTPAYMSPEQASMADLDVDTRSDVYSLGVLLYELLAGSPPFDNRTLYNAGLAEIERIIRDVEPPRPSAHLSTLGDRLTTIALSRRTDPSRLAQNLRGELDWIVMRSMEKDRRRRYDSPADLAADIHRFLTHLPVLAAPPTTTYLTRKFIRRHRVAFAFAGAVLASLILGLAATTAGFIRATHERNAKELALTHEASARQTAESALADARLARTAADTARLAESTARAAAESSADQSRSLVNFNDLLIGAANPDVSLSSRTTAREMLDNAAMRLPEFFKVHPAAEIQMRTRLAAAYSSMGEYTKCAEILAPALTLAESIPPSDLTLPLLDRANLHFYYSHATGREGESILSIKHWAIYINLAEQLFKDRYPALAESMITLRQSVGATGLRYRRDDTFPRFAQLSARIRSTVPPTDPLYYHAVAIMWSVAYAITNVDIPAAAELFNQAADLGLHALPESSELIFAARLSAIDCLITSRNWSQVIQQSQTWADSVSRTRSPDHWLVSFANAYRATAIAYAGDPDAALALITPGIEIIAQARGQTSPDTIVALNLLLNIRELKSGRLPEDDPLRDRLAAAAAANRFDANWTMARRLIRSTDPDAYNALTDLDSLWPDPAGINPFTAPVHTPAATRPTSRPRPPPPTTRTLTTQELAAQHDLATSAATALAAALDRYATAEPDRAHFIARTLIPQIYRWAYRARHDDAALLKISQACLPILAAHADTDSRQYGYALTWNGILNLRLKNYPAAEAAARLALTTSYGTDNYPPCLLAQSLLAQNRPADAAPHALAAFDRAIQNLSPDDPDFIDGTVIAFDTYEALPDAATRIHELYPRLAALLQLDLTAPTTNPSAFASRAWLMVRTPACPPEQAALALKVLARINAPNDISLLRIKGLAQLRANTPTAALATFTQADLLITQKFGPQSRYPSILAYLALTHRALSHPTEAQDFLALAQSQLSTPNFKSDPIGTRAVTEAAAAIPAKP